MLILNDIYAYISFFRERNFTYSYVFMDPKYIQIHHKNKLNIYYVRKVSLKEIILDGPVTPLCGPDLARGPPIADHYDICYSRMRTLFISHT